MRIQGTILVLAVASMAFVGCTKLATNTANNATKPIPVTPVKAASGTPISSDCDASVPPPATGEDYIVTLGPDFAVNKSGHKEGNPNHPRKQITQLDITTDITDNQSASVTIKLKGNLSFNTDGTAFQGKDASGPLVFCGLKLKNDRLLKFTTYRKTGNPTSAAYSLGLTDVDPANSDSQLTISVDPIIDNDGANSRPPIGRAAPTDR